MNMSNPFPVDDDLPMAEPVGVAQRPGVALVRSAAPTFGTYLSIVRERKWLVLGTAAVVTVLATVEKARGEKNEEVAWVTMTPFSLRRASTRR